MANLQRGSGTNGLKPQLKPSTLPTSPAPNPLLAISRDLTLLHPTLRNTVAELIHQLNLLEFPFRLFEGYRTPQRQAYLYSQGRTLPGKKVTQAQPWNSYHQYGMAADIVLFLDGKWTWDQTGSLGDMWAQFHQLAHNAGLELLDFEQPHVQLAGYELSKLHAGSFPGAGDTGWGTNLYNSIRGWNGVPTAPDIALPVRAVITVPSVPAPAPST
jgi:peptidoglycan L-alanyl-D-glutamate endopeptidase CwlK